MSSEFIHVEVPERLHVDTSKINRGLSVLVGKAEDSVDLEEILNTAVNSFYLSLENGQVNYGGEKPEVGHIWLDNKSIGEITLQYVPSEEFKKRLGDYHQYIQKPIGSINIRERTFSVLWNDGERREGYHLIPEILMGDTEIVMTCLGLKNDNIPYHY